MAIYSEFSYKKCDFSIVMLVYQRVIGYYILLYSLMWVKQCHVYHPPVITTNTHKYTLFIGGSFTIPSHGWFMALFYPHDMIIP